MRHRWRVADKGRRRRWRPHWLLRQVGVWLCCRELLLLLVIVPLIPRRLLLLLLFDGHARRRNPLLRRRSCGSFDRRLLGSCNDSLFARRGLSSL